MNVVEIFFTNCGNFTCMAEIVFLSGFFLFVCAFNRFLCFRVKSFLYDVKYRRFFGFIILCEVLDALGGFGSVGFISAFSILLDKQL